MRVGLKHIQNIKGTGERQQSIIIKNPLGQRPGLRNHYIENCKTEKTKMSY